MCFAGLGDHPPSDEEGYLEFARNLPRPDIYEAISQAQALTPISLYARTGNVRRRYDEVGVRPAYPCPSGDVDQHASGQPALEASPWRCMAGQGASCMRGRAHRSIVHLPSHPADGQGLAPCATVRLMVASSASTAATSVWKRLNRRRVYSP